MTVQTVSLRDAYLDWMLAQIAVSTHGNYRPDLARLLLGTAYDCGLDVQVLEKVRARRRTPLRILFVCPDCGIRWGLYGQGFTVETILAEFKRVTELGHGGGAGWEQYRKHLAGEVG